MPESLQITEFIENSPFPWWSWNVPGNRVTASRHKVENLGYSHGDFMGAGYEMYTDLLHEEDYNRAMEAMYALLQGRSPVYQVDYRILAANGSYHWYMDRGIIIRRLPDGSPEIIRGIVLDLGNHLKKKAPEKELIRLLRSALPSSGNTVDAVGICSSCGRIRTDGGWLAISEELSKFLAAPVTHTICDDCLISLYPDIEGEIRHEFSLTTLD